MLEAYHDNRRPLAERVAEQIENLIKADQIHLGEKLPNEFELAQTLNVGRGTIREAVKLLVSRNVLAIKRGKGTYISENPGITDDPFGLMFMSDKRKMLLDLLDIRFLLEPQIAERAALNATEEEISRMWELCAEIENRIGNKEEYIEIDAQLHKLFADSAGNLIVPNFFPMIHQGMVSFFELTRSSQWEKSTKDHRRIIEAIERRDAKGASDAMFRHLSFNKDNLVALIEQSNETL